MKKYFVLPIAVLAASFVVSCQKETPSNELTETIAKKVTIHAGIPAEGLTKVSLTQDENNKKVVKLAWTPGDKITINGNDFTIKSETISADGHYAEFEGDAPTPVEGKYNISYSNLPDSFAEQTQSADENTDHLRYSITLTGADAYEGVVLGSAWAAEHHATVEQSSVLRLRALLPETVAGNVKKVIFKASQNVFDGGNTLSVNLTNQGTLGTDKTLDVYATLPAGDVELTEDMDLLVQFQVSDNAYDKYTAYRQVKATPKPFFESGATQYIGINCSNITSYANASATGIGTSANPYLIGDKYQLSALNLASGTTYIKLVDDIDMTGLATSWTSWNGVDPFDRAVNLDGNNKKISKMTKALFNDLNGTVKDLTIEDATVSGGSAITGILANTIKTAASTVTNVDINGTVTTPAYSSSVTASGYTGGLIGEIDAENSVVNGCNVTNTNVSGTLAGGVIGFANAKVTISGCTYSGGTVSASARYCGGMLGSTGIFNSSISNCSVTDATISSSADRVGGFIGQEQKNVSILNSYVSGSSVKAETINVGGFAGVAYGSIENSYVVETSVSSKNETSGTAVGLGGFVGYFSGSLTKCHANVSVNQKGSYIGGLVGYMSSGGSVIKCYAEGNVTGNYRQIGGLIGGMAQAGTYSIQNSYATGNVQANSYVGGLIGEVLSNTTTVTISNCYSTGTVTSTSFGAGGLIGFISKDDVTVSECVAWNNTVTASSIGSGNWSTGAVVGVAFPICTLTNNYRNPSMTISAWWVPDANYQHPNVDGTTHPLVVKSIQDGTLAETTAKSIASGQANRPQYAYHGKVETGKTLSQLASTAKASGGLGWSSEVWDFTGDLPTLK